jgi:type I restriction enzyme S subunit
VTPFESHLPHWTRSTLRNIAPRYTTAVDFAPDDLVWNLTLDQITGGTGAIINRQQTTYAEAGSSSFIFDEETVLYSKLRPYLNKVAWPRERGVATTELVPLKPDPEVMLPAYLAHYLRSHTFLNYISNRVAGAKMPRVVMDEFWAHEVPHPADLREQARIVELLDQADALRRQRAEADAKLARLLPALFRHHFGDPLEGNVPFKTESLGSLLSSIDSGDSPRCLDRQARPDEWSVLKLGAVTWGRFDDAQNKALPDDISPDTSLEVRAGDLLFARKNTLELVGATALVRDTRSKLLLPDLIFRLVPRDDGKLTKEYLWCLLSQPSMRSRLRSIASGAAGSMPNISKGRLEGIEIPLPPIATQRIFSRQVHAALDMETQAAASATKLETLFQTLLHRAFTGELTARWREAHLREGVQELSRLSRA